MKVLSMIKLLIGLLVLATNAYQYADLNARKHDYTIKVKNSHSKKQLSQILITHDKKLEAKDERQLNNDKQVQKEEEKDQNYIQIEYGYSHHLLEQYEEIAKKNQSKLDGVDNQRNYWKQNMSSTVKSMNKTQNKYLTNKLKHAKAEHSLLSIKLKNQKMNHNPKQKLKNNAEIKTKEQIVDNLDDTWKNQYSNYNTEKDQLK